MLRVAEHIECLKPYEPGWMAQGGADKMCHPGPEIYLASNENPLGCSEHALEAIKSYPSVHRYPHSGIDIRHKLADFLSLTVRNIAVGNGSDGLIGNVLRTFARDGDDVLTSALTFPTFSIQAKAQGLEVRTVPYKDWSIDLGAIADAIIPTTKVIYLPNPNNPTGTMFTDHDFQAFQKRVPRTSAILLDQAYYEYAIEDPTYGRLPYLEYENVIVLRTFSKAYGLAGLRLGFSLASQQITDQLLKTQLAFETNCLAEVAAIAALDDQDFIGASVNMNRRTRAESFTNLCDLGYTVVPSRANFLMLVMPSPAKARLMRDELLKRGIVVRLLCSFGLPHCVRVTIGTDEQMSVFLREMDLLRTEILKN